jgi:hypothetical protein
MAVLDICDNHNIPKARALAIKHMSFGLKGIDKVLMGRKYQVKSWLTGGLSDLVLRDASFSDQDEEQLGLKTTSRLYRIRELRFKHGRYHDKTCIADIKKEFEGELKEMADEVVEPVVRRKSISYLFHSTDSDTD